jgi:hypothetical protein
MESKKINQLATELAPELSDLTIIGDPTTGISKKITLSQMASLFTGTVEEYASLSAFPLVGTADTIYIALDTNILYRWDTTLTSYVELSPNIVTSLVFNDANGFDGTISLVGSTATLTITTALTQGSVPFIGASGALTQDNTNFFWDNSNKRLGINTNTPTGALDVFGSGIIGRLNGTSTNNAFLGFASAGSNKWSIGNVQSDHRFRIYNEATTSELFTVLQTGEIGIGIANPLTKFHIDSGATALIANLDADVSVAKSVSFRSDNSARFNIEVSGTESGSNTGANFFIRRYSDAGSLIDTPLTISRSTGAAAFISTISATSATLTSTQTNLVLNTTTNTSFSKLSFQDNGVEKGTLTYANSAFAATSRRDKLEIANTGGINFITQNAPLTPDMVISSSGNVSIGNTNNTFKLDVSGTVRFTGALTAANATFGSTGTGNNIIALSNNDQSNTRLRITNTGSGGQIFSIVGGNPGISNAGLAIFDETNSATRLYLTSTGNLYIGTATGDGYKLQIVGTNQASATFSQTFVGVAAYSQWVNSSGAFVMGLDTAAGTTERMRITSAGNIQIDNAQLNTPKSLYFAGNTNTGGSLGDISWYNYQWDGAIRAQIKGETDTALSNGKLTFWTGGGGVALRMTINSSGSIGAPSGTNIYNASDVRLKQNISTIETGLDKILALNPVKFNWIEGFEPSEDGKDMLGFIAQEVEQIIPEAVEDFSKNSLTIGETIIDNPLRVNEKFIIPVLVKAIQELETRIKQLESK